MKKSKFIKNVFLGEDQIIISDSRGKPKKINLSELAVTLLPPSGQETDPVWTSEKSNYYTKTQVDSMFPLSLSKGGTNAALIASNGGLVYSTSSALAISNPNDLKWDNTNKRFVIGGKLGIAVVPSYYLHVAPTVTAQSGLALSTSVNPTLTAQADNDVLRAVYISPVFDFNGKTGIVAQALTVESALTSFEGLTSRVLFGNNLSQARRWGYVEIHLESDTNNGNRLPIAFESEVVAIDTVTAGQYVAVNAFAKTASNAIASVLKANSFNVENGNAGYTIPTAVCYEANIFYHPTWAPGRFTNGYGFKIHQDGNPGGVDYMYCFYIPDFNRAAIQQWGLYSANAATKSYHSGQFLLGDSNVGSATSRLVFKTGTTVADGIEFGTGADRVGVYRSAANQLTIGASAKTLFAGDIDVASGKVYKVNGTQVVGARVIDARIDDTPNSGDATTDGIIDAIQDALIAHGLAAAA